MFPICCRHTVSTRLLWDLVQVDPRDNINKHSIIRTWQSSLQFRTTSAMLHPFSTTPITDGSQSSVSPPDLSDCTISLATVTFNLRNTQIHRSVLQEFVLLGACLVQRCWVCSRKTLSRLSGARVYLCYSFWKVHIRIKQHLRQLHEIEAAHGYRNIIKWINK